MAGPSILGLRMKASPICFPGPAATRLVVGSGFPARDFTEYTARRSPTPRSADIPVRQTRCEDLADKNVRARVSGRCWVYWVERNPTGEIATTVAVGQAAIREDRARKGRQQTFDRS